MLFYIEAFVYSVYMYILAFLFILIKPNVISVSLFFIYCFISTWYTVIGCKKKEINIYFLKFIMVLMYSLGCVGAFYFVHYYWKTLFCKMVVLFSPMIYLISVRMMEYFFICGKNFGIYTPIRLLKYYLDFIFEGKIIV